MMPTHRILAVPCLAMLLASAPAVFGSDWTFTVTYNPARATCFTCSSPTVAGDASMGDCLQFTAGCSVSDGENNAGACIGGNCATDDDAGFGSDMPIINPPPPTPIPTGSPTLGTASPTPAPATMSPTDLGFVSEPPTSSTPTLASAPPTPAPAAPPPAACGVTDSCNCADARLSPGSNTLTVNVTCLGGGFTEANDTQQQTLEGVTPGSCALKFVTDVNITNSSGTYSIQVEICYGEGNPATTTDGEEECKNNTGVIVIIIICVLLLLIVIGIGIYYIVHTTNAHSDGPKFEANSANGF